MKRMKISKAEAESPASAAVNQDSNAPDSETSALLSGVVQDRSGMASFSLVLPAGEYITIANVGGEIEIVSDVEVASRAVHTKTGALSVQQEFATLSGSEGKYARRVAR